jgi:hypothetical protein
MSTSGRSFEEFVSGHGYFVHNVTRGDWRYYDNYSLAQNNSAGDHRQIYYKGEMIGEQDPNKGRGRVRDDPLGLLRIRIQRSPRENNDDMVVFTEEETFDRVDLALDRMAELEGQKAARSRTRRRSA